MTIPTEKAVPNPSQLRSDEHAIPEEKSAPGPMLTGAGRMVQELASHRIQSEDRRRPSDG
jgi:hypothetical protein